MSYDAKWGMGLGIGYEQVYGFEHPFTPHAPFGYCFHHYFDSKGRYAWTCNKSSH